MVDYQIGVSHHALIMMFQCSVPADHSVSDHGSAIQIYNAAAGQLAPRLGALWRGGLLQVDGLHNSSSPV